VIAPGVWFPNPTFDVEFSLEYVWAPSLFCQSAGPHEINLNLFTSLNQGATQDTRAEVWKYLLGFYPFNSTEQERTTITAQKRYAFES
jgi:hypothetical protein